MISVPKKQQPPPPPPPLRPPSPSPAIPSSLVRQYDELDRTEIEIEVFDTEPHKYEPKSKSQSTSTQTQTHRKSVSFDLSDNEYIPVVAHDEPEPEPSDNIGELFLRQFSRENSHEENDGYEVPIKYPSGPRSKPTKQVKSILRSPSPSSKAPTTPSSLDRPLITSYIQHPQPSTSVTTAIVHTVAPSSDDEIERENPFRKEFLGRRAENIYEELDFDEQSPKQVVQKTQIEAKEAEHEKPKQFDPISMKQRPKSAYESREYTEFMSKFHQSVDDSSEKPESTLASTQSTSRSTGNLLSDRPKQKPPLPPKPSKPSSSVKSPSPVIKRADLKQNEALKTFQEEMLRGDLYEFVHDAETNQITRIKQQATSIPVAIAKSPEPIVRDETKESPRLTTFNPSSPLPPIPKSNKTPVPPYSKVLKRGTSVERPTVSPPPPPINMSTLPKSDKLKPLQTDDGSRVQILSTSTEELRSKFHRDYHHENAPEYSLVTEETHREILLKENEIRNAMQQEQIVSETLTTTSRIPVRKAPAPPTAKITTSATTTPINKHHKNTSISSDVSQEHSSTMQSSTSSSTQVFPVTQILPVQYSHLPTPQHPDYFLTFPSSPPQSGCNVMPMPQPGAFSTFMVSDNSAPQTTNIPTNIMCHPAQQLPMYLQRQFISVPISTAIHTINQAEHNLQGHNFVNIHANGGVGAGAQAPIPTTPSSSNSNSAPIFNVYRSNYNQQQQQQQQRQYYHYQTQSLLPCQQDIHSSSLQSATFDTNPNRNDNSAADAAVTAVVDADDNTNRSIGSSSFSSMTLVDSQFTRNRNNENDIPVSVASTVVHSEKSLTSIFNTTSNYHSTSDEPEPTFTTFGKQTQV